MNTVAVDLNNYLHVRYASDSDGAVETPDVVKAHGRHARTARSVVVPAQSFR
jgi:hypothetical protein